MFGTRQAQVSTDEEAINELLSRGVHEVIPSQDSLRALLLSGKQLTIKLGIDPTGANIHLGNTVPLLKLRDFQNLGHRVVFIIGDATGVIGDTSDKDSERPMLTSEQINENLATYVRQVSTILDKKLLTVRKNSEWLLKLNYAEIGEHANVFSVSDFIARDNIKRRLDDGKRVSLREVLYPLMQGYDSVAIQADVELGGSDQRFNVLAGRPLQEKYGQAPQHCLLFSLMPGTDGDKMSKSRGNTINIFDDPNNMFGKVMSARDEVVEQFFISATRVPLGHIETIMSGHPKDAKLTLAEELVRMYHGTSAAVEAREQFEKTFARKDVPDDVPEVSVGAEGLMDAVVAAGVVASKTEYRRLVSDGAIRIVRTDEKLSEHALPPYGEVIRIGKHRFVKITK
ncbi:MAG: tyrosine--tRNA ligase [Candidatus Pacebacteria bacterium]|nr:tyrosine--tRNA ligase [Candidatus Paceibacterota bacterium]